MASKPAKSLFDLVTGKLTEAEQMHFNYHKLFLNGVTPTDNAAVTEFIQKEYMDGMTLEEFALAALIEKMQGDISKISTKNPVKADTKKAEK